MMKDKRLAKATTTMCISMIQKKAWKRYSFTTHFPQVGDNFRQITTNTWRMPQPQLCQTSNRG
eukprot:5412267-Amphidinium_carterae.2